MTAFEIFAGLKFRDLAENSRKREVSSAKVSSFKYHSDCFPTPLLIGTQW